MTRSIAHLLATRRFLPLFLTQFLGAFNDNLFKNALAILVAYRLAEAEGLDGKLLVTIAGGVFILPFFLLSATAGQLADRSDKARLIRRVKEAEVAVMALGAVALVLSEVWMLLAVLFLMGAQSAFFGPLKYGILPDHLDEDELIGGNGLVETGTFLAILAGTIAGALLILEPGGVPLCAALVVGFAALGRLAAHPIPPAPAADPQAPLSFNVLVTTWRGVRDLGREPLVLGAVIGISWFWLLGATFLVQFPNYAKEQLNAGQEVVTLFLTLFSVGIGIGSLLCNRLLKGRVSLALAPFAAIAIALFCVDLHLASPATAARGPLLGVAEFLDDTGNWRLVADLLGISVAGGLYIVPLYAVIQTRTAARRRARTVAANNILNALFMVVSAAATGGLFALGASVTGVFATAGLGTLAFAALTWRLNRFLCQSDRNTHIIR